MTFVVFLILGLTWTTIGIVGLGYGQRDAFDIVMSIVFAIGGFLITGLGHILTKLEADMK
jgi:hypothetical protein